MRRPTTLADEQGVQLVASLREDLRKELGIYLTPEAIARYMASRLHSPGETVRVLDPAAGGGVLICALIEQLVTGQTPPKQIEVVAYEIQPELHGQLCRVLSYAAAWSRDRGVPVTIKTYREDYVAAYAGRPFISPEDGQYDLIIANPPYFKLGSKDPRYLSLSGVVPSQPNMYSLFMTLSVRELKPGGEMVYIVPRSFASGSYFRSFRRWFFSHARPLEIHMFGSRRQAFKRDAVLQENVIIHARRVSGIDEYAPVILSHSDGIDDLDHSEVWTSTLAELIEPRSRDLLLRLPSSPADMELIRAVDSLPASLSSLGLTISTGPVVAFRAGDEILDEPEAGSVPLLWLNHVRPGEVVWPVEGRTNQHLLTSDDRLLVEMQNLVLIRRFSAKDDGRRLTAAPLIATEYPYRWVGLENHLNYIYRTSNPLSPEEARGLSIILNSRTMDRYVRCVSGNTQVGAAELRHMPLPPMHVISDIGRQSSPEIETTLLVDHLPREGARELVSNLAK